MGDPGTFWLISPSRDFKKFSSQRSYSVMVALTQKSFSPQYGWFWFCRGRSYFFKERQPLNGIIASSMVNSLCGTYSDSNTRSSSLEELVVTRINAR